MSAFQKQEKLREVIEKMYKEKGKKPSRDFALSLYDISDKLDLSIEEIGNLCQLTTKILEGDQTIGSLETAILQNIDETNRENMGAISAFINNEVVNKIKYDIYGQKTNLVPEAQEPIKPAMPSYQTPQEIPQNISETIYEKISREQVLRDLENPPPAKFSVSNKNPEVIKNDTPQKSKAEEEKTKEIREVPIVHTMSRDIAQKSGAELQKVTAPPIKSDLPFMGIPRGKFGTGSIPQVRQMRFDSATSNMEKNQTPKEDVKMPDSNKIKNDVPQNLPVGNIPVPPSPKALNIPKVNNSSNPTQDKLTKIIHTPMERKNYSVDPYRESLE